MLPRLKSLELHGYKTFANRTLFEFPGLITAIVGPNGSGKSNIADAIRWVLGEQSYSLLRGRKTEDMIFAGSEQRPRAGMASATITFDNADGWLPIDYSEVSLTRRAYRDGQNEYLLNGQRVRLREISELLAQSGLAERTYTIIGQGLVDAALALKPEERRRLFEEAAGIGLYRSRREESLNRLEATRRNLDRVQDIMAEIEPRLQSLERQARRAQEYERIKADLRLLLRDWYGYHWHKSQEELAHSRDVLRVHETKLEQARQKLEDASSKLGTARGRIQELREKLNDWHAQSSRWHEQREKASRELAILDERMHALVDQRQRLLADRNRLEDNVHLDEERLEAAQVDMERFGKEQAEANAQAENARQLLKARLDERSRVNEALSSARREQVKAETRLMQLKAHLDEVRQRIETQDQELSRARQASDKAEEEYQAASEQLDREQKRREQLETDAREAAEKLHLHQQKIGEAEERLRKLRDELASMNAEATRLRVQMDLLEQAEKSLSGYADGARSLVVAASQGKIKGVLRTLGSLLDVPAEYEPAISAALGDYLEGLVLEDTADPEDALEYLQSSAKGRAALLPRAWMRTGQGIDAGKTAGVVDTASRLVRCDPELRPVVDALLGNTIVVRTRAEARAFLPDLHPNSRVVTLAGEVFSSSGAVIGGKAGRSGALSRPREIKELSAASADIEKKITRIQRDYDRLNTGIEDLRSEEKALESDRREKSRAVDEAVQTVQKATLGRDQAKHQHDWQQANISDLQNRAAKALTETQKFEAEIKDLEGSQNDLAQQVRQLQAQLAGLPVDEVQAQTAHWEASLTFAARTVKEAETRVDERTQILKQEQDQLGGLAARLEEIDASTQAAEKAKEAYKEEENHVLTQIASLQLQIEPAEEQMRTEENSYDALQKIEDSTRQALNVAERYHSQAQLEFARERDTVDSLHRRIEEDFGLVAFEYNPEVSGQTPLPLEGMVEQLPAINKLPSDLEESIARHRAQLRRMGAVNPEAQSEYESVLERYEFLTTQVSDLHRADEDLRQVIAELDELMRTEFKKTFEAVAGEFKSMFSRLFEGGNAHLVLTDAENPTETGIDIEARLPGRREQGLTLLSGGERSLTAAALVFALLKVSPTPFCVMDEVDAMLDESNVGRFRELLRELSDSTQFIIITHNRNTVQAADVIYGVTMGRDSASQVISLRLDDVNEELVV